jgi:hypothetical protein
MTAVKEALSAALRDENNLPPTDASLDVLMSAVLAMERLDENWSHAGAPSAVDYAAAVIARMRTEYLGWGSGRQ